MPFQFYCPQGHLLSGEPAQSGQTCQCPICQMMFIIPQAPGMPQPGPQPYADPNQFPAQFSPAPVESPQATVVGEMTSETAEAPAEEAPAEPAEEELIHIPCPNGHELETPKDMVGQDVMCPHCEVQFRLKFEDSIEYKEKRRKEHEHREHIWGKRALQWAIVAAVLVVLSLVGMIVFKLMDK